MPLLIWHHYLICLFTKLVSLLCQVDSKYQKEIGFVPKKGKKIISFISLFVVVVVLLGVRILTTQGELNVTSVDIVSTNKYLHKPELKVLYSL